MPRTWDSFKEGDALPELIKKPGVTQLVKYAAGGGDFNPLHHDFAFPQAKAIGSIIVHGRFKYAALGAVPSLSMGGSSMRRSGSWSRIGSTTVAESRTSRASIEVWTCPIRR